MAHHTFNNFSQTIGVIAVNGDDREFHSFTSHCPDFLLPIRSIMFFICIFSISLFTVLALTFNISASFCIVIVGVCLIYDNSINCRSFKGTFKGTLSKLLLLTLPTTLFVSFTTTSTKLAVFTESVTRKNPFKSEKRYYITLLTIALIIRTKPDIIER